MSFLQNILFTFFPKYKKKFLKNEHLNLLSNIASELPDQFQEIKYQVNSGNILGFVSENVNQDYKSIIVTYSESITKFKKRGENFKISGLKIFSKRNNAFEEIELLVRDNLFAGIKITNSQYELGEFDLTKIIHDKLIKSNFFFPPNEIEIFYDALDPAIKKLLNPNELIEIEFNNKTFYSFYDLEDGNYLAVDKKLNIYSLVHDANPMVSKMKSSFIEILIEINENRFDKETHFDNRYRNSK